MDNNISVNNNLTEENNMLSTAQNNENKNKEMKTIPIPMDLVNEIKKKNIQKYIFKIDYQEKEKKNQ